MKLYLKPLTVALTLALAGCGGGGSDSKGPTTKQITAIDGYLQNADVFIDVNNNGLLDDGDVTGKTDMKGVVSFPVDTAEGHLFLTANAGTKDSDTGDTPQPLSSDDSLGLSLQAPVGSSIISPITDLIMEKARLAAGISSVTKEHVSAAETDVLNLLNQNEEEAYVLDDLYSVDFMAASELKFAKLKTIARLVGALDTPTYDLPIAKVETLVAEAKAELAGETINSLKGKKFDLLVDYSGDELGFSVGDLIEMPVVSIDVASEIRSKLSQPLVATRDSESVEIILVDDITKLIEASNIVVYGQQSFPADVRHGMTFEIRDGEEGLKSLVLTGTPSYASTVSAFVYGLNTNSVQASVKFSVNIMTTEVPMVNETLKATLDGDIAQMPVLVKGQDFLLTFPKDEELFTDNSFVDIAAGEMMPEGLVFAEATPDRTNPISGAVTPGKPASVRGTLAEAGSSQVIHLVATNRFGGMEEVKLPLPEITEATEE